MQKKCLIALLLISLSNNYLSMASNSNSQISEFIPDHQTPMGSQYYRRNVIADQITELSRCPETPHTQTYRNKLEKQLDEQNALIIYTWLYQQPHNPEQIVEQVIRDEPSNMVTLVLVP